MAQKKALIAMSGGVDSSLAAKLMIEQGYTCVGCTMRLHHFKDQLSEDGKVCGNPADVEDAKAVAAHLGMPFELLDYTDRFREQVMDRFVCAYENGQTPNPCIECNRYLKFAGLLAHAKELGCDCVVTGHYARVEYDGAKYVLKKALDESKDQSYVLYSLTQDQLSHVQFPLGGMHKSDVRRIAEESSFVNANKADSQDICFIPDGDYAAFIEKHSGHTYPSGDFVDTKGKVLGQHKGIIHYTIGQRKGLGIAFGTPLYVKKVDTKANQVILSDNASLFESRLIADHVNWTSGDCPAEPVVCKAKIRYRHKEQPCVVTPLENNRILVEFEEPQRAITPGQAVVLYDGDVVLGGGIITG